jgi:hypothetical protein
MSLNIAWDQLDRTAWDELFAAAGRSALVQSWAWGEAKRVGGAWIPRRAVVRMGDRPVALAQVLERRLGPLRIGRLNRGPVWLGDLPPADRLAVLDAVRAPWRIWRLAALSTAPEWPAEQADALSTLGLRRRRMDSWCSAWLDLSKPAEELRRNLDSQWRRKLNTSEKSGLVVEMGAEGALDWLLDRHVEVMADRGYDATSPAMVRALAANLAHPGDLLVLRALNGDEPVAGVLMARHGAAATYVIGWNSELGLKLMASRRLLWEAGRVLAADGAAWMDLGGIDPRLTPGIAAFKRGMNGEEYRLAGEYFGF